MPIFKESKQLFKLTLPLVNISNAFLAPEVAPEVRKMLSIISGDMTREAIQKKLGLKNEKHFRRNYQQIAVKSGLLEMTIPEKPNSRLQKYRLTEAGRKYVQENN